MTKSRLYIPTNKTFDLAVKMLKQGDIVSFPTETVYGLGADATNSQAVAKIFEAKSRPSFNPLIVHISSAALAGQFVTMNDLSAKLAECFWPGPFTMVLPLKPECGLSDLITAGLDTVAIRVPKNETAHELLAQFGGPIAAPSANKSGNISPTSAAHVSEEFGDNINMIIDSGPCEKGIESTIAQVKNDEIILLRPGNITAAEIEEKTGIKVKTNIATTESPVAPGQLKSHYAPNSKMRLNVITPRKNEAFLAFGPCNTSENCLNLSPDADLAEAATNLFSMMRALDHLNLKAIAVAPIPHTGLGIAINDRLERAAAPKG